MNSQLVRWAFSVISMSKQALEWWLTELHMMVPARLRASLDSRGQWTVVDRLGDEFIIGEIDGNYSEIARINMAAFHSQDGFDNLPKIPISPKSILRIADASAVIKVFELPLATENGLRSVLGYEIERQTPFSRAQVYFDCKITERNVEQGKILVAVAIVQKKYLDDMLARIHKLDISPKLVGLFPDHNLAPDFKFDVAMPRFARQANWRRAGLACVVGVLIGLSAYQWAARQDQKLDTLNQQIAKAKAEGAIADKLQLEISALQAQQQFILQKYKNRRVIEVIDQLTRLLPDDTWVYELEIKQKDVRLIGYSSKASSLISVLDSAPFIRNTKFVSPIVNDGRRGDADKIDLSFEMEGMG